MALSLYDTATRAIRPFEPIEPGKVSMYVCGATVQSMPHIGHTRSSLVFDVLSRWLSAFRVRGRLRPQRHRHRRQDPHEGGRGGATLVEWATTYERAFNDAYDILGCLKPSVEPRATGHIPQMHTMIAELIEAGHAYAAGGDVYFAVRSLPTYGALSGQRIDEMAQGESVAADKRDPADFTLWKGAKPGEPYWDSPWGPGRPGWHIECSAMARAYLGRRFDIHGGGLDLVFPHHENERAQAVGAGDDFADLWMHHHWVTLGGEKMSKSLGNTEAVPAITAHTRAVALRFYLISAHYRSPIEYSEEALADSVTSFNRVEGFLLRVRDRAGAGEDIEIGDVPTAFAQALDDDLHVPRALAVVHEHVRQGNTALEAGDHEAAKAAAGRVRAMLGVLGTDPLDEQWATHRDDSGLLAATSLLVNALLEQRAQARAGRDFATSDRIRDQLAAAGFVVQDSRDGATWALAAR